MMIKNNIIILVTINHFHSNGCTLLTAIITIVLYYFNTKINKDWRAERAGGRNPTSMYRVFHFNSTTWITSVKTNDIKNGLYEN